MKQNNESQTREFIALQTLFFEQDKIFSRQKQMYLNSRLPFADSYVLKLIKKIGFLLGPIQTN